METELKITQVQPVREYTNHQGEPCWVVEVALEDGRSRQVTMKSPERWKEGMTVVVKKEWDDKMNNPMMSLDKPLSERGGGSGGAPRYMQKGNDATQQRIGSQWAINSAISFINTCHPNKESVDIPELKEYAKSLIRMREELVEYTKENGHG